MQTTPLNYNIVPVSRRDGVRGYQWQHACGARGPVLPTYQAAVLAARRDGTPKTLGAAILRVGPL